MQNLITDNILLTIFLPFWIFLIIMVGRFVSIYVKKIIIYSLSLLSNIFGCFICVLGLYNIKNPVELSYPFIKINDFVISLGIYIDKLSLIMAIVLFSVSFCVQLYSVSYVKNDKKNYRFFALLNLFNFAMSALLFSPNLFQLYVFWEIAGIASYLLIGFDYTDNIKSEASKKVFLINRFGDTALISAIILTSQVMYNYGGDLSFVTLSFDDFNVISALLFAYTSAPGLILISTLFILAATVKSAQYPFHIWLQEAMEAKIPVSALLHSATLVAAGIYLIIRIMPILVIGNLTKIILIVSLFTALVCSIFASIELNPKKILAYSTSANLGLMFLALGLENIQAALIFFSAHAFIKSLLFLSLPNNKNEISKIRYIFFVYGALSLAGLLLSGFCAKETLYCALENDNLLSIMFLFITFLSAFYISRLCILIKKGTEYIQSENILENSALSLLFILSILLYIVMGEFSIMIKIPFIASLMGILAALILNRLNLLTKITKLPKFSYILINKFIPFIYEKLSKISNFIDNKIFANYTPITNIAKFGVIIFDFIEKNIMNRAVISIKNINLFFSNNNKILQSGNVQTYNGYAFIFITIVMTFIILSLLVLGQGLGGI